MKHLSENEVEELRGALEAEKDSLQEELSEHGRPVGEGDEWEGASFQEGEEADPNVAADGIEELATNIPLVRELQMRHKDVVTALDNMEKGTYGICEVCGAEIPLDRLEADPAARTCVAHA